MNSKNTSALELINREKEEEGKPMEVGRSEKRIGIKTVTKCS